MIVGTMPLIGINTAILAVIAIIFKLNMPLIQLVNYAAFPLQLLMYLPFIKAGEYIFMQNLVPFSLVEIRQMFAENWLLTVKKLWMAHMLGLFVWTVIWIPVSFFVYNILKGIFEKKAGLVKESKMNS